MKYLRATVTPDPEVTPAAFGLIADSEHVAETRLLAMNVADSRGLTALFAVEGDVDAFRAAVTDAEGIVAATVASVGETKCYLLATLDTGTASFVEAVFDSLTSDGVVVLTPVRYRDGEVRLRLVGETAAVQGVLDSLPPDVAVEIHEIGRSGFAVESPAAALSERQREALGVAVALGYYDVPRRATHEDVADRLDCAPSTAAEHLQKAEATLVRTVTADAGPRSDRTR